MRPTVIRLIVGGTLGIAFSVSLWLPGTVVFPEDARIRHLAAPEVPSTMVVRAAPVAAPKKAPAPRRVVVRPVYVPPVRTAPVSSVVRQAPSTKPASKPVIRTTPPAKRRLTPLSAPRPTARRAKKAKRRSWDVEERRNEDRERDRDHDDEDDDDDEDDEDEGGEDREDG